MSRLVVLGIYTGTWLVVVWTTFAIVTARARRKRAREQGRDKE